MKLLDTKFNLQVNTGRWHRNWSGWIRLWWKSLITKNWQEWGWNLFVFVDTFPKRGFLKSPLLEHDLNHCIGNNLETLRHFNDLMTEQRQILGHKEHKKRILNIQTIIDKTNFDTQSFMSQSKMILSCLYYISPILYQVI